MIRKVFSVFFYSLGILYLLITFIFILNIIITEDYFIEYLMDNLKHTVIFTILTILGFIFILLGSIIKKNKKVE